MIASTASRRINMNQQTFPYISDTLVQKLARVAWQEVMELLENMYIRQDWWTWIRNDPSTDVYSSCSGKREHR